VNLRKTAGLLAVTGLIVGLLGSGVGAAFVDQVIGTENIAVGTFDCQVTGVTDNGSNGSFDANSATYNAPTILSSAPGSAPFAFTVKNFGTIPMLLSVSGPVWGGSPGLDGSFTGIAPVLSSATLAAGASATVSTGIQWTTLDNADLGTSGWARWTVACNEGPIVTEGYATGLIEAAGVRYKAVNTGGEIYLGKFDLGVGANRVEVGQTWADGSHPLTFAFDGASTISTTLGGLSYVVSSPACASSGWNKLDILVREGPGTTDFNGVEINGIPIGSFGGSAAGNHWTVSNVNLGAAFTVTGVLDVTGWGSGNEAQKLQLMVGCL
jgi:hypothetical protein